MGCRRPVLAVVVLVKIDVERVVMGGGCHGQHSRLAGALRSLY
jgi:hypothetical protein